jgi:sporulation protein YlmC with PRC-barrel domain
VRNPQGQDLGEIQDLIVDVNNQRVHYAVLAFGGFLGLGEKLFAYPVRLLTPSGDALVLNVSKQQLERAPGFERNRWPDWADNRYREQVDRYFGPTVALQPRQNMQLVRASHLIGKDVNDQRGHDAGEIEDVVVNLGNASIHYVVLDFDKAWSPDDKLVSLPMNALRVPADRDDDLVLNVPREKIDMSAGFDDNSWPDLNDPIYQQQIGRQLPTYQPWTHTPNQVMGADPATDTRP